VSEPNLGCYLDICCGVLKN